LVNPIFKGLGDVATCNGMTVPWWVGGHVYLTMDESKSIGPAMAVAFINYTCNGAM